MCYIVINLWEGRTRRVSDVGMHSTYNLVGRPKSYNAGRTVNAFNGTAIGKGHLAEAKAAINSPRAAMNGAQSVFSRREEPHAHGSDSSSGDSCGTSDTTQRDELLAKIAPKKDP